MSLLNLRCACCGKVEQSQQDTKELENAWPEDICMCCFLCRECSDADEQQMSKGFVWHMGGADPWHLRTKTQKILENTQK